MPTIQGFDSRNVSGNPELREILRKRVFGKCKGMRPLGKEERAELDRRMAFTDAGDDGPMPNVSKISKTAVIAPVPVVETPKPIAVAPKVASKTVKATSKKKVK